MFKIALGKKKPVPAKYDLTGQKFGSWTVISLAESSPTERQKNKRAWVCKCDCGSAPKVILGIYLRKGESKGCRECMGTRRSMGRKSKTKIDKEMIITIVERYNNGDSSIKLAEEFDISATTVLNYVEKLGFKTRSIVEHGIKQRQDFNSVAPHRIYLRYIKNNKTRNLKLLISEEKFKELILRPCEYCGILGSNSHKLYGLEFKYNGLDRINNDLDYTEKNSVPCCRICNVAKNNLTEKEFREWIERIVLHNIKEYFVSG